MASATLTHMLNRLRQTAPAVALLICVALLATWTTGAHAHRHVGGHQHEHVQQAWAETDSNHEHGHSHEVDSSHAPASGHAGADGDRSHFGTHSLALAHDDGHENIEVQALQPPSVKSLLDLPLLALVCFAILLLSRTRRLVVAAIPDPPDPKRVDWSLRPPLRGPPSSSVV